jgi:hypothetical protein
MRLKVRFTVDEDYGRSLGQLRDLLKTQAKLAGLEIRKRPDGAEIVGLRRRQLLTYVDRRASGFHQSWVRNMFSVARLYSISSETAS